MSEEQKSAEPESSDSPAPSDSAPDAERAAGAEASATGDAANPETSSTETSSTETSSAETSNADAPASAGDKAEEQGRLKKLAMRGGMWEMIGHISSYVLRFGSRTLLGALLFPAAFGVMEIINGLQFGLIMLSDVGIHQAIIQSKRGDEQVFLDTAFTMHVVRGVGLWLVACVLTYPIMWVTGEPELVYLIPVGSLTILILGFHSTSEFTLRRQMAPARLIAMDTFVQMVTVVVTVTWASYSPSVWALLAGGLVNASLRMVLTHWLGGVVGYYNRFRWDPTVRKEIFEFGKWITGSSAVDFASMWGDRLLLVTFLGTTVSGVYATAVLMADTASGALNRVVHGVFYPLFSRVARDDRAGLREMYYDMRMRVDWLALGATGGLAALGPWVIHLLFDERYAEAGWMLRLLCVRAAFQCIIVPCETCLISLGHTRNGFYSNVARATWIVVMVPIGYYFGGVVGVVWAATFAGLPSVMVLWPKFHKEGLLRLDREAFSWLFFAGGALIGFGVEMILPEATEVRAFLREVILGR